MRSLKNKINHQKFFEAHKNNECFLFERIIAETEAVTASEEAISSMKQMAKDKYFQSKIFQRKAEWEISTEIDNLPELSDQYPWTLLVHHLDKYLPLMNEILLSFDLFPSWSLDDVMGSYSSKNSVTPAHIDSYDVFLLQLSGRREWSIQKHPETEYQEDQPLRILKEFRPDAQYVLGPGDMLFVPHGTAHEAKTLESGLSLSIGIQALNLNHVLMETIDIIDTEKSDKFFVPSPKVEGQKRHVITEDHLEKIKKAVIQNLINKKHFDEALLIHLNRYSDPNSDPDQDDNAEENRKQSYAEFKDEFEKTSLFRAELSTYVAIENGNEFITAIGNNIIPISSRQHEQLSFLFSQNLEYEIELEAFPDMTEILYQYYSEGILFFSEE